MAVGYVERLDVGVVGKMGMAGVDEMDVNLGSVEWSVCLCLFT